VLLSLCSIFLENEFLFFRIVRMPMVNVVYLCCLFYVVYFAAWFIHRPVFYLKYNFSETGFCLRLQVKAYSVGPNQ
jgi:hypothetical protein